MDCPRKGSHLFPETPQSFLNAVNPAARAIVESDPSADNFRHWHSNLYDERDAKILERYKEMNGQDGNSPIITGSDDIAESGSTLPDNEDLNADNTLQNGRILWIQRRSETWS